MPSDNYKKQIRLLERVFEKKLFFVCGVMKSGTTWYEKILDAHPSIVCKGEAHFGSSLMQPLSELLQGYNKEVSEKGGAVAHLKKHGGGTDVLSYDEADWQFLSTVATGVMFGKWLDDDKAEFVGDKTPSNLENMSLLGSLFPDAKFLHIIRDGRDTAVSLWHFNLKTNVTKTVEKWGTFDQFVLDFAEYWQSLIAEGREYGKSLGSDRYFEIRYEDLLQHPLKEMQRTAAFLGLETTDQVLQECIDKCAFSKLSGGRDAGEEDVESFYRKGVSGDWENHFSDELHEDFVKHTNGMLDTLGYL
jgi:hypothetical protein